MISTKSERKPLKSTIWLTDQFTRKFKNISLQNFQTWQFMHTSLSLCKQQRNGLNGTRWKFELFPYLRRKVGFAVFCWLAKFIAKRVCCVVHRMIEVLPKMAVRLLEVRRRLPVSLITCCKVSRAGYIARCIAIGIHLILVKATWQRINQWQSQFSWVKV